MFWVFKFSFVVDILAFFGLATFWAILWKIWQIFFLIVWSLWIWQKQLKRLTIEIVVIERANVDCQD